MKKQLKKALPRGRPWKKGQSGCRFGRPKGAKNKLSSAVSEANRLLVLNRNLPFEVWGDKYVQFGRIFRKDNFQLKNPEAPVLPQTKILDARKPRQEVLWKNHCYYIQDGWLYKKSTWKAVRIY